MKPRLLAVDAKGIESWIGKEKMVLCFRLFLLIKRSHLAL